MSASMAEEMAAILAQHEDCAFSASGVVVCSCGAALQPNEVMWEMSNLAAHQAEQLAANGYGKLEEAWDAGYRQAKADHCDNSPSAEYCDIESDNPYRRPQ